MRNNWLRWGCYLIASLFANSIWAQGARSERVRQRLAFFPISEQVMMHTSFRRLASQATPANGLLLKTSRGVVLIDATWDYQTARALWKRSKKLMGGRIKQVIITSHHEDRSGGLWFFQRKKIPVYALPATAAMLTKAGFNPPEVLLPADTTWLAGETPISTFFAGNGCSADNLAVYIPSEKILFGGCLLKSATAIRLAPLDDSHPQHWKNTLNKLFFQFPDAAKIVPGRGPAGGRELFQHSINLVELHLRSQ